MGLERPKLLHQYNMLISRGEGRRRNKYAVVGSERPHVYGISARQFSLYVYMNDIKETYDELYG